jgi:hypothetical protein
MALSDDNSGAADHTALLFTGHMVDLPGRAKARFPSRMEPLAAEAIRAEITRIRKPSGGALIGIASGARGGDILFHEACHDLGTTSHLVLPFGREAFFQSSVRGVETGDWEARFKALWRRLDPANRTVLKLAGADDPFGRCNDVMHEMAQRSARHVEMLALWDGADAGKPGGTGAFVESVKAAGGHVTQIDTTALLKTVDG